MRITDAHREPISHTCRGRVPPREIDHRWAGIECLDDIPAPGQINRQQSRSTANLQDARCRRESQVRDPDQRDGAALAVNGPIEAVLLVEVLPEVRLRVEVRIDQSLMRGTRLQTCAGYLALPETQ